MYDLVAPFNRTYNYVDYAREEQEVVTYCHTIPWLDIRTPSGYTSDSLSIHARNSVMEPWEEGYDLPQTVICSRARAQHIQAFLEGIV